MLPKLMPMDVIVVDRLWYMPHHWLISWRGLDPAVHVATVKNENGDIWSPEFFGIKNRNISYYKGRTVSIHRMTGEVDREELVAQASYNYLTSKGYDFLQWFGAITGICKKEWIDSSNHWDCAEFPYWPYQDKYKITPKDDIIPQPRMFRYNPAFECIYEGKV